MPDDAPRPRVFGIRNNLTMTRVLALMIMMWAAGLFLLFVDNITIDWMEVLSVAIAALTLFLGMSVQLAKLGQRIEDQGIDILELKNLTNQLLMEGRNRKG